MSSLLLKSYLSADQREQCVTLKRTHECDGNVRLLLDSVVDYAIFSIDLSGRILSWNSGAERLFGYLQADVLGKHFSLIYTPEAVASGVPNTELVTAMKNGDAADDGWHVRRGGELFYASGHMTRLKPDIDGISRGFVKVAYDITARYEAAETLKRQAYYDELTQLPNRALFNDSLRRSIARAKRYSKSRFAVLFLDLDRFKIVNDSLGHVMGDALLVHVARVLERCVRPEDIVARFGGDEFTILLSDVHGADDVTGVATRIHTAFRAPVMLDGFELHTSASMGIVMGSSTYATVTQVLCDADTAMYDAKRGGRARYVLFDSALDGRTVGLVPRVDPPVAEASLTGQLEARRLSKLGRGVKGFFRGARASLTDDADSNGEVPGGA